jgi:ABC-type transport system substrate-binding protein
MRRSLLLMSLILASAQGPAFGADEKGTFYHGLEDDPTTLNPITRSDAYSSAIVGMVVESLAAKDENTYEWMPLLAEKWEEAKDGKSYTIHLRDGVKFSDGTPVTVEDVKYSFDVFFEGRFQAPHQKVYLENISEAKILGPKTVQFLVKQPYYLNKDVVLSLSIIPKAVYGTGDPKDPKFNKLVIGAGPYILEEWEKGQKITLKKNPAYWADLAKIPYFTKRNRFAKHVYRIVADPNVAFERLKRGDIDFLGLQPEQFVKKTTGPEWGKKVFAVKATNNAPQNYSYGFVGWNQKNPLFKEKETRHALAMLINRDLMIEKFRFNMSEKAKGPLGNRSPSTSPKVKPIEFDPKKALATLQKVGWKLDAEKGLIRTIDGQETKFEFTLLSANPDFEKYATVMKEDMKAVGITMNYKFLEWNSFIKLVDERKFDAINMAWQVNDLESDQKQIFHSSEIPSPGHNFIAYANPVLDKLIEESRITLDAKKRRQIFHKISETIADDQPYAFLFNPKFSLYAHSNKVKKPQETLKYGIGLDTWTPAATD